MNTINTKKLLAALSLFGVIALIPLASTNAFAQNTDVDSVVKSEIRTDVTDIKPNDRPDKKPDVKFNGETKGWAIVNGQAFLSKIGLEGVATHKGDGHWEIKSEGKIGIDDKSAILKLKGFTVDNTIILHGVGTQHSEIDDKEPNQVRVFLRGNFAPIANHNDPDGTDVRPTDMTREGDFALAFTHAGIKNMDNGINIPLMQVGKVHVAAYPVPEISDSP